ncbi:MAG: hemolysin family protein [Lachnospiraceae bacterium]
MDPGNCILLIILILLIFLSAFFSSSETAFTTVNKMKLRSMMDEGHTRAGKVLDLIETPQKLLSAILIGNNIVNLSASAISTTLAIELGANGATGIATGIITLVILVFGEITPKTLATMYNIQITIIFVNVFRILSILFTPVIYIVNHISYLLLRIMRVDPNKQAATMTESELRSIVDYSHEEGVIETKERKMITNVFDFGDSVLKDIMIPRIDLVYLSTDMTYEEVLEVFEEEQYTRYPVFEESKDSVIGILNVKDMLLYMTKHEKESFHIQDVMREPFFSYEYQKTSSLLDQMKENSISITIVLDEYGACAGIVTLEDLVEEIVGDIRDEFDEKEEDLVQQIGDYEYEVNGTTKMNDFNDIAGTKIESEDYDTIGGHIIELLDGLPDKGDEAVEDNITYKVLSVENNRIEQVLIIISPEEEEIGESYEAFN